MQNNFIEKISPSIRLIILIILIISLFLAKSIYLILLITILTLILFIITDKKVKIYVKFLKSIFLLLLFFFIIYIIIFRQTSYIHIIFILYKLLISSILVKIFFLNVEFVSLHQALYGLLLPLKKFKLDIEIISLYITITIYFIKFLLESNDDIKIIQKTNGKKILNIKNYLFPRVLYSINKLDKLQENLKIKFYKLNYKKSNLVSRFILVVFIMFLFICIYKEVIL